MRLPQSLIHLSLIALFPACGFAAAPKPKLPIGEFCATRMKTPPTIDGRIDKGEWDGALTSSGMIAPFEHALHEAETTVSLGFDDRSFYFLFNCRRGNREWRLRKTARQNDAYSFGDSSIEIWVTPPALVGETYQSIINTFPAVMDVKMVPSRGYSAMGWTGRWKVGVTEDADRYVIEAAAPIEDFGFPAVKNGDVWRFLLCRTSPGTRPRSQASWSVTQGFAELNQHPKVHLMDDEAVVQLFAVVSIFTGKFEFPMAVVAPRAAGAEVEVELRIQKDVLPAGDDRVEKKRFALKARERQTFSFSGDVTEMKKGCFTITATKNDGTKVFQQSFPFEVNGFVPQKPVKGEKEPDVEPLAVKALYGPESNVLMAQADIIDLPERDRAASATMKVIDPATKNVLASQPLPPFVHWYANAHLPLDGVAALKIPLQDHAAAAAVKEQNADIEKQNAQRQARGEKPLDLKPVPQVEPKAVTVEVSVADKDGKELKTSSKEVKLLRHRFPWQDNSIGITDKVIPPWTPVTYSDGTVGVWNRKIQLDGLGLVRKIINGGVDQIGSMRIVAVKDGKEVPIQPSEPAVERQVDAAVTLSGSGAAPEARLRLSASTRVEFDGFTLIDLTIAKDSPGIVAKVDKLYLEVVLPEAEATHFCTTAGGWAAVHDVTPARWDSRQTASGQLIGDFVPYIWLTNSDRAFLWFADNDKGWTTDDDKSLPTQELQRENGKVTLRVNFVEKPAEITVPIRLTWGYQTFPSRPLPPGWRSIICSQRKDTLPSARNTYFWFEGDWAVLWPYYCSPYPWNMEKSRQQFSRFPANTDHRPCVGSIAHSIGRYRDYEGSFFNEFAADWGATPGEIGNSDVTQGKGPIDFRLYHYQRWVREAGFRGLYVDENYLGLDENFLTGGAYLRADNRLQRGYSYLGLREYFKRMKVMFHQNHVPAPNLWQHITSGAAYHAWPGDVFFEGENVEPTDLEYDYLAVLPAGRMRAIGSAPCAGGVMTMMCQSQRHATIHEPKHTHQFVGWVMAHDILPEGVQFYNVIAQEGRLYEDDVQFIGYWKEGSPFKTASPECLVSAHKVKGRCLVWVVNTSREDRKVDVAVDFNKLGLDKAKVLAVNAETGEMIPLSDTGFSIPVLNRDFAAVHLVERRALRGAESFHASFDRGRDADEALGCCVLPSAARGPADTDQVPLVAGVKGQALSAQAGVQFWPHLHLTDEEGRITFQMRLDADAKGAVLSAGPVSIALPAGKKQEMVLRSDPGWNAKDKAGRGEAKTVTGPHPGEGWHLFDLSWKDGKATLRVDDKPFGEVPVNGLGIGKGTGRSLTQSARFIFGGSPGTKAVDEVRCYR